MRKSFILLLTLLLAHLSRAAVQKNYTNREIQFVSSAYSQTRSQSYNSNYLSLFGHHGLCIPITKPAETGYDFTVMFAFRVKALPPSENEVSILIDNPKGLTCLINYSQNLICNTGQVQDITRVPSIREWVLFTYTTDFANNKSYLQIDQPTVSLRTEGSYMPLGSSELYLFIGEKLAPNSGLYGDIAEFYMTRGKLNMDSASISAMIRNKKVFTLDAIAYYQFDLSIGILADSFRYKSAQIVEAVDNVHSPILYIDEGTKLICDALDMEPFQVLPVIESGLTQSLKVPNFDFNQKQYAYTVSIWLKSSGAHKYSQTNQKEMNFFVLENVISLWYDSPSSFRAYIFATKDYQEVLTTSVQIAVRQWCNIQFVLDQKKGLLIQVYAQNGALVDQTSLAALSLPEQIPSGQMRLLRNFVGQVKTIHLWQQYYQLPIQTSETDKLRFALDFQREYFHQGGWQPKDDRDNFSLNAQEGRDFYFVESRVPREIIPYANPSTLGVINSVLSLWDGGGCRSNEKNLVFVEKGAISTYLDIGVSNQLTVEFWFRFAQPPSTNNTRFVLHSLESFGAQDKVQSLTVLVENGTIKCYPFGDKSKDEVLVFKGIDTANERRWQHISCGLTQQEVVVGQYLAFNLTETRSNLDLQPLTFVQSLMQSEKRLPNYLRNQQFQSQLGSSKQPVYFRDLRIWNTMRTIEDIYTYRFKQIDSVSALGLVLNYRLIDGNSTIVNNANKAAVVTGHPTMHLQNGELIICVSDRYFDPKSQTCKSNPYEQLPITFFGLYDESFGLQLHFTNKYALSDLLLPTQQPIVSQTWSIEQTSIQVVSIKRQQSAVDLVLDPYVLGDGFKYVLHSKQLSSENAFWQLTTQTFYPLKCVYFVDKGTHSAFKSIVRQERENTPLYLRMAILNADGCYGDIKSVQVQSITVDSQPFIEGLESQISTTFDFRDHEMAVMLPDTLMKSFPLNQPVNLIFSAYWSTDKDKALSYINNVYQVIVVEEITIDLQTSGGHTIDLQTSMRLFANGTHYTESGANNGLYFRWVCPDQFQVVCDKFDGLPMMELTADAFEFYGGRPLTPYPFSVLVWNLLSGGSDPQNEDQIFAQHIELVWATFEAPVFEIIVPLLFGQTTPQIVSSQTISLSVDFENYRLGDPRLNYEWDLQPEDQINANLLSLSLDDSIFTIERGALKPQTSYSLKLSVYNVFGNLNTSTGVQYLNFTTGTPPFGGSLSVSPQSGTMFQTAFQIRTQGWQAATASELRFNLWGITQTDPLQMVQIGVSMQLLNNGYAVLDLMTLPLIVQIRLEVYDSIGEIAIVTQGMDVRRPQGYLKWAAITEQISFGFSDESLLEQKYLYFAFVSQTCSKDYQDDTTDQQDCLTAHSLMLNQAQVDIYPILPDDTSQRASLVLQSITTMLEQTTKKAGTMNSTLADESLSLLQSLGGRIIPFQTAIADTGFQHAYVQSLSNLMEFYTSLQQEDAQTSRNLQADNAQEDLNAIMILINNFQDELCSLSADSTIKANNIQISTSQFNINDERTSFSSQSQRDGTIINLPLNELLRLNADYDLSATSVCVQVSHLGYSPFILQNAQDLEQLTNTNTVQVKSLDNNRNRVLRDVGLNGVELAPLSILYYFDFEASKQFVDNQTMCMAYGAQHWVYNGCKTTYHRENNTIHCQCQKLNSFYYGLVNDFSRAANIQEPQPRQITWPIYFIFVPLILFLALPLIGFYLDYNDRKSIEDVNIYSVTDDIFLVLQQERKYPHVQTLWYKVKDIEAVQKWKQVTFCSSYWLISWNLNPVWAFMRRYDYREVRAFRAVILLFQVALITLIEVLIYVSTKEEQLTLAWVLCLSLAGLCLPLPQLLLSYTHKEIVVEKVDNNIEQVEDVSKMPTLLQRCLLLKVLFVFVTFCLYTAGLTVTACALFSVTRNIDFTMTIKNSTQLVLVWYFTLIVGFGVYNMLLVMSWSILGYLRANQILLRQQEVQQQKEEKQDNPKKLTSNQKRCDWTLFIDYIIPQEATATVLDANCVVNYIHKRRSGQSFYTTQQNTKPMHTPKNDVTQDQLILDQTIDTTYQKNQSLASKKPDVTKDSHRSRISDQDDYNVTVSQDQATQPSSRSQNKIPPQIVKQKPFDENCSEHDFQDKDSEPDSAIDDIVEQQKAAEFNAPISERKRTSHHSNLTGLASKDFGTHDQYLEEKKRNKRDKNTSRDKRRSTSKLDQELKSSGRHHKKDRRR